VPWSGVTCLVAFLLLWVAPDFLKPLIYRQNADDPTAETERGLIAFAFSLPFMVTVIGIGIRMAHNVQLYQFGLTGRKVVGDSCRGLVTWLWASPLVMVLHTVISLGYEIWTRQSPKEHDIVWYVAQRPDEFAKNLMFWTVVVIAPIREEIFFRGLLQPWLSRRIWGGNIAMIFATVIAIATRDKGFALWVGPLAFLTVAMLVFLTLAREPKASQPLNFVASLAVRWIHGPDVARRLQAARAIFGTSVLFGMVHFSTWPNPIPLAVLGLALGWLAHRTQSIIGPMVVHSLFNAVSATVL